MRWLCPTDLDVVASRRDLLVGPLPQPVGAHLVHDLVHLSPLFSSLPLPPACAAISCSGSRLTSLARGAGGEERNRGVWRLSWFTRSPVETRPHQSAKRRGRCALHCRAKSDGSSFLLAWCALVAGTVARIEKTGG
jgi:hypothetical protein